MSNTITVVGLGAMGGAMAAALSRAGWQVTGFDPSPAARADAEIHGVHPVDELETAAGNTFVVLSLPSAEIVREVVPVLLAVPGTIGIIDTTTSDPATSRDMAELSQGYGVSFVDAPVSGGRQGAATGQLSAFVGGDSAAVEACSPVLRALTGGSYTHLGASGSGNVVKLINNALAAANLVTVGEALAIAKAWGVDPEVAATSVSNATGASRVSSAMYPDWILSGTFNSGFSMRLMARDIALATQIAKQVGEAPHLLAQASALWQDSLAKLGNDADFSEIVRAVAPNLAQRTSQVVASAPDSYANQPANKE